MVAHKITIEASPGSGAPLSRKYQTSRNCRYRMSRPLTVKLACVGLLVLLIYLLPVTKWADWYLEKTHELPRSYLILYFILLATVVFSISPTGYLPVVLAGVTFGDLYTAWPVAYISIGLGAAINLLLVRVCIRSCARQLAKRKLETFKFMEAMVAARPILTVLIFRCSYLYVGVANYLFSLSSIATTTYLLANMLGFIPVSMLFVLQGRNLLWLYKMLRSGQWKASELAVVIVFLTLTCAGLVILLISSKKVLGRYKAKVFNEKTGTKSPKSSMTTTLSASPPYGRQQRRERRRGRRKDFVLPSPVIKLTARQCHESTPLIPNRRSSTESNLSTYSLLDELSSDITPGAVAG